MTEGDNVVREELIGAGLLPARPDGTMYQTDEPMFKTQLITPQEPIEYLKLSDGRIVAVPKLTQTMALGNLNTTEVKLARLYAYLELTCKRYGYYDTAINYYYKIVHLNVTSQSHQAQLLSQVLTQNVRVSRREESFLTQRETAEKGVGNNIVDKIKESAHNQPQQQGGTKWF